MPEWGAALLASVYYPQARQKGAIILQAIVFAITCLKGEFFW